jgi:hypothetical protein
VLEEVSPELQEFEDHPVDEEHCDSPAKRQKSSHAFTAPKNGTFQDPVLTQRYVEKLMWIFASSAAVEHVMV